MQKLGIKQAVVSALEASDYNAVMTLALADRKVLSALIRLAYHKDTIIGWRSIIAIGRISSVYIRSNADFLRETARKLLWSLTDESGGIGWSAPEILGEIVSADPKKMADIIPLIAEVFTIEEKVFRPGVLYALKRIAESLPEAIADYENLVVEGLQDGDPMTRARALQLLEQLLQTGGIRDKDAVKPYILKLMNDNAEVWIFHDDGFSVVNICDMASNVLKEL